MKIRFWALLCAVVCLLCTACGGSDRFQIKGTVEGKRTMNLRIAYTGRDNINNVLTAARDGVFEFAGQAPDGALVEVLDNDYRPIARFYAEDGDRLEVFVDPARQSATRVKGNDVSERWTAWLQSNAAAVDGTDAAALNNAVARYVKGHTDDVLSALLLSAYFNADLEPARAARLLASLKPEARPAHIVDSWRLTDARPTESITVMPITYVAPDSTAHYRPARHTRSMLAFSADYTGRTDSIVPALRRLRREHRNAAFVDMWCDNDTLMWHRSLAADSVDWPAGWLPASVASPGVDRLRIPSLPYFIVADAKGRQLYRGPSVTAAVRTLTQN